MRFRATDTSRKVALSQLSLRCVLRLLLFVALPLAACGVSRAEPALEDGDLIFHTSRSSQSVAIQLATHSPYSHMGMIVHRGGKPFVLEASATVRYTPLHAFVARGDGGRYVVKRLREARSLTPEALRKAARVIKPLLGKPYDLAFDWSDQRMYCSELVWKIYERALGLHIGELVRLGDFDLSADAVRQKLKERYGAKPPLEEPVISPQAMFESALLVTVLEH